MTILITGANRGIGRALLDHYRTDGRAVIGTHRDVAEDGFLSLDVTDPASHVAMAKALGSAPLDLLVCNAGVYLDKGQGLDGYDAALWAQTFAVNVTGVFLTIQALLPNLRAGGGKIAIIGSQMGSNTRAPGGSYIYRASKSAVLNLGRNLATDLAGEGIAVGVYHPGWVRTDMGGGAAEIDAAAAAAGLVARFDALSPATSGCFETWDGRDHPL